MLTQWAYLFFSSKNKSKTFKEKQLLKKKKMKLTNTFTSYQDMFSIDEKTAQLIRYKCINCSKINYNEKLYCDIDCETNYKLNNENN